MEYRKDNYIELFNEFSILMCAYVMNVFCEGMAPAPFMNKIGWAFMSFSMSNILLNVVCLILGQIYSNGLEVKKAKARKDKMRVIELRLQNLKIINKYDLKNLSYI